jgi:hypothetical protein
LEVGSYQDFSAVFLLGIPSFQSLTNTNRVAIVQNITVQKILTSLIAFGFFIASPWLISEAIVGNFVPLAFLAGTGIMILFFFVLRDRSWLMIPFCLPIQGRFNFLPLNFNMQEVATLAVFSYLVLQIVMGRQISWRLGPAVVWIPLAGLLAVLFYHWIRSGDIGIRSLGGAGWGGRKYVLIVLTTLTLPILHSSPNILWSDLQKIPFLYFCGTFIDLVPDTFTTLVPVSAPYIFRIFSSVNIGEYGKAFAGNYGGSGGVTRFAAFGPLGSSIVLMLFSYVPFYTWLAYTRLWVYPVFCFSFIMTALSGYRTNVFNFVLSSIGGIFCWIRFRVLFLFPVGTFFVFTIILFNSVVTPLPLGIQRSLSFLPGNWDPQAKEEGRISSEWRDKMTSLFYREYFNKAPLFGYGYQYDKAYAIDSTSSFLGLKTMSAADEFADVRSFIEMRQPHEGDIHALLVSGVVGSLFFIVFCVSSLIFSARVFFTSQKNSVCPVEIWSFCILLTSSVSFFVVYGDYSTTLPQIIPAVAFCSLAQLGRVKLSN